MSLKVSIRKFSVYEYFDTTKSSPIRQLTGYSKEARFSSNSKNLAIILQQLNNHHSISYDALEDQLVNVNPPFKIHLLRRIRQ